MPDVYATISDADREVQERLADVIELRAADPRYQSMVRAYLSAIGFPPRNGFHYAHACALAERGIRGRHRSVASVHRQGPQPCRRHRQRLPQLIRAGGFDVLSTQSHGYLEAPAGAYMLTWIERGADVLLQSGCIGEDVSNALKAEAHRRSAELNWFGHIAFASVIARKPAPG